jgi:hypothetical protein
MTSEVLEYFKREYEKSNIRVVPGHWPDFKDKDHVDKWIKTMESIFDIFNKE